MKKRYLVFAVLLIVVFLVSGCLKIPAPVKALANGNTGQDNDVKSPGTDKNLKQCDEAINYQVLIDALPKSVNGFVAGEPEGNMLTFTDPSTEKAMKYSTASVRLEKDDKDIQITLTDTCYLQYLSMAWLGFYEMEGTSGYLKKTTVSGFPGWHQYDKSSSTYTYNLFVKDRVIVSVEGSNGVADSDVEAATKAIGLASIASAAK